MTSPTDRSADQMTDDQYRQRFIDRLSMRFVEDEHMTEDMAQKEAAEEYAKCPRPQMADEWKDDPDNCADEVWLEWRTEYEDEGEDDEWDGDEDEDWDPYEAAGESRFGLPGGGRSL